MSLNEHKLALMSTNESKLAQISLNESKDPKRTQKTLNIFKIILYELKMDLMSSNEP